MVTSSRLRDADSAPDTTEPVYAYPRDEFDVDDWEGPVGAHRAARRSWLVALPWLAAAAAILVITGIALAFGLGRHHTGDQTASAPSSSRSSQASASSTAGSSPSGSATTSGSGTSGATGTVNRQTQVQILNSTRRNGLAHTLQSTLRNDGWNVPSVSTYRGGTLPSVVYYRDAADQATAEALAKLYGLQTRQSSSWRAPVTLMIGPGFPQP